MFEVIIFDEILVTWPCAASETEQKNFLGCLKYDFSMRRVLKGGEGGRGGGGVGSHFPVLLYEKSHSHLGFFQNFHLHFKRSI